MRSKRQAGISVKRYKTRYGMIKVIRTYNGTMLIATQMNPQFTKRKKIVEYRFKGLHVYGLLNSHELFKSWRVNMLLFGDKLKPTKSLMVSWVKRVYQNTQVRQEI